MEVYKMLPEGTLAELINGQLYMSPTPSPRHQRLVGKLFRKLSRFIEDNDLGEILLSPTDVYLDEEANAVQPDLLFISKNSDLKIIEDRPIYGVPDLVIEILSPSNNQYDLTTKKNLYEKFGVTEYWIIDPFDKSAHVYQLQNKTYQLTGKDTGKVYSPLFQHAFEF